MKNISTPLSLIRLIVNLLTLALVICLIYISIVSMQNYKDKYAIQAQNISNTHLDNNSTIY